MKAGGVVGLTKARRNALTNVTMFALLMLVFVSGMFLAGLGLEAKKTESRQGNASRPSSYETWVHLHVITSALFIVVMVIHLAFHASYIKRLPALLGLSSGRSAGSRDGAE